MGSIYTDPPSRSFNLNVNDTLNEVLGGWQAAHVIVDNWTNQYLELTDIGRFVGPGEHGGVYPLPGVSRANAVFAAPVGIIQPSSPVGVANLVFLHGGVDIRPAPPIVASIVANPPFARATPQPFAGYAAGTYNFDVPSVYFKGLEVRVFVGSTVNAFTVTINIFDLDNEPFTYPILSSAALGTNAVKRLRVYPGITPTVNEALSDVVGPLTRIQAVVAGGTHLYHMDYSFLV